MNVHDKSVWKNKIKSANSIINIPLVYTQANEFDKIIDKNMIF